MPRKSPKETAKVRETMKAAIRESDEEIIERLRKEALKAIRRLSPEPMPQAPSELWPGESFELGGWALAAGKKKKGTQGGFA